MNNPNAESVCCPPFDPTPWDQKTLEWTDKLFIKNILPQLFHLPIPGTIGRMVTQTWKHMEQAGATPEQSQYLWICHDPSPWKSEHYFHVTKEVPGFEHARLSGTYMTKVFEGPFSSIPKWIKEMEQYIAQSGHHIQKLYFYFTTCPKCAKKYGKNHVVLIAQV